MIRRSIVAVVLSFLWSSTAVTAAPILDALEKRDKPRFIELLAAGADVNVKDKYGNTPLHIWAADRVAWVGMERALLAAGADVNAKDALGRTPLHLAANFFTRYVKVKTLLAAGADVNAKDKDGVTPLHLAAGQELPKTEAVTALLAAGADANAKDKDGVTPLHLAVGKRQEETEKEVVTALLAAGADVNAKDALGRTPLHWGAGRGGEAETEKALLAAGADANAKDKDGVTPLHLAATADYWMRTEKASDALLPAGADVNAKDNEGQTPLHWAARRAGGRTARVLLGVGADVNAKDNKGQTPLHMAAGEGEAGTASTLLSVDVDVNAKDDKGQTPLHMAAGTAEAGKAKDLLAAGADVNAKDDKGQTPLHMAAGAKTAKVLLAAGADVNARDDKGQTPLHMAAGAKTAKVLLAAGADVNARDNRGQTPALAQSAPPSYKLSEEKRQLISHFSEKLCRIAKRNDFYGIEKTLRKVSVHFLGEEITFEEAYPYISCYELSANGNIDLLRLAAEHPRYGKFYKDMINGLTTDVVGKTLLRKIAMCKRDSGGDCLDVFEHFENNQKLRRNENLIPKYNHFRNLLARGLREAGGPVRDPKFCREVLDEPLHCHREKLNVCVAANASRYGDCMNKFGHYGACYDIPSPKRLLEWRRPGAVLSQEEMAELNSYEAEKKRCKQEEQQYATCLASIESCR